MAEFDFADGFDVSEPLAWGLAPAQVGVAAGGLVLAYLASAPRCQGRRRCRLRCCWARRASVLAWRAGAAHR